MKYVQRKYSDGPYEGVCSLRWPLGGPLGAHWGRTGGLPGALRETLGEGAQLAPGPWYGGRTTTRAAARVFSIKCVSDVGHMILQRTACRGETPHRLETRRPWEP